MAKLTAQEYVDKHARNLKNALPDIKAGIARVTTAPGVQAAREADRMLSGVQEAVTSGRWASKVGAVTLQDWQDAAINKGANRIGPGIDAAKMKNVDKATRLLAATDQVQQEVAAMPKGTLEDSIARMTAAVRRMHEFKGKI